GSGGSSDSCPALVLPGPSLPEPQALGSRHIEHGGHPGSGDSYTRLQVHRDVLRLQVLLDAPWPPSRPKPDCLTPPKGAAALETLPWLRPTISVWSPSTTRRARLMSLV